MLKEEESTLKGGNMENPKVVIENGREALFAFSGFDDHPRDIIGELKSKGAEDEEISDLVLRKTRHLLANKGRNWEKEVLESIKEFE